MRLCEHFPEYHPRKWVDCSSPAYRGRTTDSRFISLCLAREGERDNKTIGVGRVSL